MKEGRGHDGCTISNGGRGCYGIKPNVNEGRKGQGGREAG